MKISTFFKAPKNWDKRGMDGSFYRFEQSGKWALMLSELSRPIPHFLEVWDDDELIASLLCFDQKPWDSYRQQKSRRIRDCLSGTNRGSLTWQWAPMFFTDDEDKRIEAARDILDWVEEYVREKRLYQVRVFLPDHIDQENNVAIASLFEIYGFTKKIWANYFVDLKVSEDEIWDNLKASARKAVKKGRKKGLKSIEIQSHDDFENLWLKPYREFEMAAGRKVYAPEWFRVFWDKGHGDTHRFFVCVDGEQKVMAVLGMTVFGGMAREFNSAMNPEASKLGLPAQDVLHWEMMLSAKNQGCTLFNLSGVDPDPQNGKAKGIRQFKAKWGGSYVEYPRYSKRFYSGPSLFGW